MKYIIVLLLFSNSFNDITQGNTISSKEKISLTLLNQSPVSIPLIIPSVMNPNLSPFSKSGVTLKVGQKIYFKESGKRYLLIEVDESLDGQKIIVNKLLRERKRALGL